MQRNDRLQCIKVVAQPERVIATSELDCAKFRMRATARLLQPVRRAFVTGAVVAASLLFWQPTILAQEAAELERGALEDSGQGVPRLKVESEISTIDGDLTGGFTKVVWSSDGTRLAAYNSGGESYSDAGNTISVWTVDDSRLYRKITVSPGWPFLGCCSGLAFIGHGRELVTPPPLNRNDLVLSVYDIDSGVVSHEIAGPPPPELGRNAARSFAVSPDESLLVAVALTGPQPIFLYSTATWDKAALNPAPRYPYGTPSEVAFSPDGELLAWNNGFRSLSVYNVHSRHLINQIDAFPDICCISEFSFGDHSALIAVVMNSVAKQQTLPNGEIGIATPSPHGFVYAPLRDPVRIFRTSDGSRVAAFHQANAKIRHLTWDPRGPRVAFATAPDTFRFWDTTHPDDNGRLYQLRATIFSMAFSPDGSRLAVANGRYITIFSVDYDVAK